MRMPILALLLCLGALPAAAPTQNQDDGFVPMFNGKDLTGWVNVNCAPETFFVKDGMIITDGKPTGYLRTAKQYENFIAEFDWMHVPKDPKAVGNSGFFVWADPLPAVGGNGYTRGIEVQVLVNLTYTDKKTGAVTATSHGDLFSIWGAKCKPDRPHPLGWERCLPSENNCKGANEWNHYRVYANDGVIKLTVNGKEVSGVSECNPKKGYLGLESEGSECRFKNLKVKELPSTGAKPEQSSDEAKGFVSLYTGRDLRGWQASDDHKKHWKARGWNLAYDGKGEGKDLDLSTDKEYGDFELIVDWRLPSKTYTGVGGSRILLKGSARQLAAIFCSPSFSGGAHYKQMPELKRPRVFSPTVEAAKKLGDWNRCRIKMKNNHLTVYLNNQLVIDNVQLDGMSERRHIGLEARGDAIEFANLFVRELGKDE